ncbi:DUF6572 domain-containing protein [Variovorax ureilyticus]|uniref:DUF6572 domain-containing protein n=1 Tax=Variovorax ureilyticus TaxID=1836198 RepID=UPI003D67F322
MGVLQKDVIDRCGVANDGKAVLTMYCEGKMGQDFTVDDVGEKAETYLEFVLSGQFAEQVPASKGRPAVIRISCEYWPHSKYKETFRKMAGQLAAYDIGLVVDVSSLRVAGGIFDYSADSVGGA